MVNKVVRYGSNSLAVSINKSDADFFGWALNDSVMVDVTKDEIKIRRLQK